MLCGTGAHGAYHAGVLRALHEAGVKIDVVAGQGVGAASAMLAAIDGGSRLWEPDGIWRLQQSRMFYGWRRSVHAVGWAFLALLLACVSALFVPPDFWKIAVTVVVGLVLTIAVTLAVPRWQPRARRATGGTWWSIIGAPFDPAPAIAAFSQAVWQLVRGASRDAQPPHDAGRRYAEVLGENLGQPGFRELMIVATDLDARSDITAAMLREPYRREFMAPRPGRERRAEAVRSGEDPVTR